MSWKPIGDVTYRQTQLDLDINRIKEEEKESLALVNIVLLMAKANRKTIAKEEFEKILKDFFKINPEEVIPKLEKESFLKEENKSFILLEDKEYFEERVKEIKHNSRAIITRMEDYWLGNGLFPEMFLYCLYEARNELQENKFEYIGKIFEGKKIVGVGGKAIALENEKGEVKFCNFYRGNGHETAQKIIKEHGDLTNPHLKYITKDVED